MDALIQRLEQDLALVKTDIATAQATAHKYDSEEAFLNEVRHMAANRSSIAVYRYIEAVYEDELVRDPFGTLCVAAFALLNAH